VKYLFTCLLLLTTVSIQAQPTFPTITVTGESTYNLSPNEIIITISYQEYFTDPEEALSSKVAIETIEPKVLASVKNAGVPDDKVTMGEARLIRPRMRQEYGRRRINKSISVCVSDTEAYLRLIRQFEKNRLFDQEVTEFNLTDYRHTEREQFEQKCQGEAFADARAKAERIAAQSDRRVGKLYRVMEQSNQGQSNFSGSTYDLVAAPSGESGFQGIIVRYRVEAVFELLD
jgi:uncharacterized protein YggE